MLSQNSVKAKQSTRTYTREEAMLLENSPKAFAPPHTARDRGCGRCNSEERRQQVGIYSKFILVSEITKDRRTRTREEHPRFVRILTKRFNSLNKVVRILTKSTLVLVTEVLSLVLPIRSHPINPIRSSPAGGGPGFFRDGRHTSGHGSESGRAARAVRGRCGRLRSTYTLSPDALSRST